MLLFLIRYVLLFLQCKHVTCYSVKFQNGKNEFIMDKQILLLDEEEEFGGAQNKATSPMPGVVDKISVKVGDVVKKGDPLFVIIAMKMEHVVKANADAVIENVFYNVGESVAKDAVVVQFAQKTEENNNNKK